MELSLVCECCVQSADKGLFRPIAHITDAASRIWLAAEDVQHVQMEAADERVCEKFEFQQRFKGSVQP